MKREMFKGSNWTTKLLPLLLFILASGQATAQVIASDMTGSTSQNLISYTNPFNGAFSSPGDGFQKYQRGVSPSIPFSVLDDSLTVFPGDSLGIIPEGNTDIFFGVTDTENGDNSGPVTATWVFSIAGGSDLALSIDMGAMGDFESSDTFEWSYSIDGGPTMTAFISQVDEAGSNTYILAGGSSFTLNDPMTMQGSVLTNDLASFSTLLSGAGSELTLTLTAQTNGGSEAFAFQNIEINAGGLPLQVVAFDMVDSGEQNLTSFVNPFDGAFASAGDGFQKYQRGVSSSIPFSVLDDSLTVFPGDTLGIIPEGNTDIFFGATDTENGDNSGPVTATWTFDVAGAIGLGLLIDMGAMGDFESSDTFTWTYSIDGAPTMTAFQSAVDELGDNTYTLAGGASFTLNDPMTMQGTVLTNELARFMAPLVGSGNELVLTLTAETNGGTEAFAFQNIIIIEGVAPPEPPPEVEIFEIQGAGSESPFNGETVIALENVVTAVGPDGFFMQTPASRADGDVDTSDGIFVYTESPPTVAVGDLVDVVGEVREFFGFTEFTNDPEISVIASGAALPPAVLLDAATPSPDPTNPSCAIEFECYEGMLVEIQKGSVTGPNQRFGSDPVAEVNITASPVRTYREVGIEFPGLPGLPVWDGNPEVFELDPDKLGLANQIIPAGSSFSAIGVIGFEFGGYEFWPMSLTVRDANLSIAVRDKNEKEISIGSLNLFRLFDDFDDAPVTNAIGEVIDDQVVSSEEYNRRLTKFVDYIANQMKTPDILAVQEVEKLDVLQDLADRLNAINDKTKYRAYLEEGNDIGSIDVGFLVRDQMEIENVTQLGAAETYVRVDDGELDLLHDRPPLLLEIEADELDLFVMVVHNRSLGGIETERVQQKRFLQARSIAEKVQAIQDDDEDNALVVIGDFNAFEFTDGYVDSIGEISGNVNPADNVFSGADIVNPDLINQTLSLRPNQRYTFNFRGNAQALDHALTNRPLDLRIRGLEYARGNADAAVDLINDESTALRSSDHDGLVLYVYKAEIDDDNSSDDGRSEGHSRER